MPTIPTFRPIASLKFPALKGIAGFVLGLGLVPATPSTLSAQAPSPNAAPMGFKGDIAPILIARCLGCHGADKPKGGYRLDTFANLARPGSSRTPPIVARQPDQSHLLTLVTAADADDRMPQDDAPLSPVDIARLRAWIEQGAVFDGDDPTLPMALLVERPPGAPPPESYPKPIPISALAFHSQEPVLAVGGSRELTFWDAGAGTLVRRQAGFGQRIQAVAFSPVTNILAVSSGLPGGFGEVSIVASPPTQPPQVLCRAVDLFPALRFSRDGMRLAVGGVDGSIRVFGAPDWRPLATLRPHADWVTDLQWSADGRLFSTSRDRTSRSFEAADYSLHSTYAEASASLLRLALGTTPDVAYVLAYDRQIHRWKPADGNRAGPPVNIDTASEAWAVVGDRLFLAQGAGKLEERDRANLAVRARHTVPGGWILALESGPGEHLLAIGTQDGQVHLWNVPGGKLERSFVASPIVVARRADGVRVPVTP